MIFARFTQAREMRARYYFTELNLKVPVDFVFNEEYCL
jgi:hypothetical protein